MRILLHLYCYAGPGEVFEPLLLDVHPVLTGEQIHERKVAVVATGLGTLLRSAEVSQGYSGTDNRRTRLVRKSTGDRAIGRLCMQVNGRNEEKNGK
jgi:hypothetical protein